MTPSSLLHLLRLASPALPIGGYAYSQGLEWAVHQGWVDSEQSLSAWLEGLLQNGMATLELPMLARMHRGWTKRDVDLALALGRELLAWRDCPEARLEEHQMGGSLAKLLLEAGVVTAKRLIDDKSTTYLGAFALACSAWSIPERDSLLAFAFSWAESQVTAGVKLIPLGQTAGQRVLARMMVAIDHAIQSALEHADEELYSSTPGRSLAQLLHAGQDVRLFRS
jgi:urease accessory protein